MEKFIYKLYKFMYGRNGADELYKFCLFIYLLILVINIFVNNIYINLVSMLLFLIIMYRFFSKDIYKRKKENDKYLVQLLEKKNLKENERLITMNLLLKEYAFEKDGAVITK